jgi:hypothetical protein
LGDDDDLTEGQCGQQEEGSAGSRFHVFGFVMLGLPVAGGRLAFGKTGGALLASEAVAPVFLRSLSLRAVKLLCRELGDL